MERIEDGPPVTEKDKEGNLDANLNQNANTERVSCSEVQENGHISPKDTLNNGQDCSENGQSEVGAAAAATPHPIQPSPPDSTPTPSTKSISSSSATPNHHNNHYHHSNSNHQGHHNHQGHSPNRYSPNSTASSSTQHAPQLSPRGCSPQNGGTPTNSQSPPNHQHVVHVYVNPGETFSVRVGDQVQHIQGR